MAWEELFDGSRNSHAGPRSSFVTTVAWNSILLAGFGTFVALLQNVMVRLMPREIFKAALQDGSFATHMPRPTLFLLEHVDTLALGSLLLSVVSLIASIGLLHRRNWARILFMGLLVLCAGYSLAGLFLQRVMIPSFALRVPTDPAMRPVAQQFQQFLGVFQIAILLMSLAFAGLFAWLFYKMGTPGVRDEFANRERLA